MQQTSGRTLRMEIGVRAAHEEENLLLSRECGRMFIEMRVWQSLDEQAPNAPPTKEPSEK